MNRSQLMEVASLTTHCLSTEASELDSARARSLISGLSRSCPSFVLPTLPTLLGLTPALGDGGGEASDESLADVGWMLDVLTATLGAEKRGEASKWNSNSNPGEASKANSISNGVAAIASRLESLLTRPSCIKLLSIEALSAAPSALLCLLSSEEGEDGEGLKCLARVMGHMINQLEGSKGARDCGVQVHAYNPNPLQALDPSPKPGCRLGLWPAVSPGPTLPPLPPTRPSSWTI